VVVSRLHFLSDFDGVWTEPTRELQAVHATVVRELARLSGRSAEDTEVLYQRFAAAVLEQPEQHGWKLAGRLSSFVDEDFFALPTAVGQWLDVASDPDARRMRAAVLTEWGTVLEFLDFCYHSTCSAFREEHSHDLAPGAERVLEWLIEHEVSICFATNAPAEKVIDWFAEHGYPVADGRAVSREDARLRVFGRAGKQWLSESPHSIDVGGRAVAVDRPQYREILKAECPDVVVGDVFSLDLALPSWLRSEGLPGGPQAVGLMHMRHTPEWLLSSQGAPPEGWVDWLVPHVTSLPRLFLPLLRAPLG